MFSLSAVFSDIEWFKHCWSVVNCACFMARFIAHNVMTKFIFFWPCKVMWHIPMAWNSYRGKEYKADFNDNYHSKCNENRANCKLQGYWFKWSWWFWMLQWKTCEGFNTDGNNGSLNLNLYWNTYPLKLVRYTTFPTSLQ